jgi:competence protein ComEC
MNDFSNNSQRRVIKAERRHHGFEGTQAAGVGEGAALYSLAEGLNISKRKAFWPILGSIWLYTLFVGATPTVIRAAVMGTIVVVGQRMERRAHAWTTLFAACWAMTVWDPQTLWDMGIQLSALATASLFAYGKGTEAILLRTPLRAGWLDWAREALTATLAAQILALPLILYQFGNLSIIAPLANVVMLPVVPSAMLFGAIALLGGMLWLPLGQWLAVIAYLFLAWLTEGARVRDHAVRGGAAAAIPAVAASVLQDHGRRLAVQ